MKFKKYLSEQEYAPLDESGRFNYASEADSDAHRTIKGLMKNNGIFKTMKQRWYLLEKRWKHRKVGAKGASGQWATFGSPAEVKKMRNIRGVEMGDYVVEVDASMTFGKRGAGHGTRWLTWAYVIDDVGVREEYKLGYKYDGQGGSQLDHSKIKKTWERKETEEVKEFRAQIAQEEMQRDKAEQESNAQLKASEWIGTEGERIKDIEVTVLRKHYFETQYGESSITIMKDSNGNMIKHFGRNNLKKGEIKKVAFTVKAHEKEKVNKWNKVPYKVTSVSRVK